MPAFAASWLRSRSRQSASTAPAGRAVNAPNSATTAHAARRADGVLPQLANLRLQQRPALRPELVLPGRVDVRQPGAERRLVDLVEDEAGGDELVAQAGVDP